VLTNAGFWLIFEMVAAEVQLHWYKLSYKVSVRCQSILALRTTCSAAHLNQHRFYRYCERSNTSLPSEARTRWCECCHTRHKRYCF